MLADFKAEAAPSATAVGGDPPRLHVARAAPAEPDSRRRRRPLRQRIERIAWKECRRILTYRCAHVGAAEAAAIFSVSEADWHELDARGEIPEPTRLDDYAVWRLVELVAWVDAGTPRREDWRRIRDVAVSQFRLSTGELYEAVLGGGALRSATPSATRPADDETPEAP